MNRFPHGHMSLLEALEEYLDAAGNRDHARQATEGGDWQRELGKLYAPHRLVFAIPADIEGLDAAHCRQEAGQRHARLRVSRQHLLIAGRIAPDLMRMAQARV